MSHYTVAVITKTGSEQEVEELLSPFDENLEYNEDDEDDEDEYYEAKWDWWTIGGRWFNSLRDKKGDFHNTLQIKDWDYTYADLKSIDYYLRFWEINVEGAQATEEEKEKYFTFYRPEYLLETYGNKTEFAKTMVTFFTYAILTPDGEWLEPGRMGWFGLSSATPEERGTWEKNYANLIDFFDKDLYVTVVDCHI